MHKFRGPIQIPSARIPDHFHTLLQLRSDSSDDSLENSRKFYTEIEQLRENRIVENFPLF